MLVSHLLPQASVLLLQNQIGGETSESTHPTSDSASPLPHETVIGIVTGIGTGKGIGTGNGIGEMPPVDDMEPHRRGSGRENEREMAPQGGRTRRTRKRRNHQ